MSVPRSPSSDSMDVCPSPAAPAAAHHVLIYPNPIATHLIPPSPSPTDDLSSPLSSSMLADCDSSPKYSPRLNAPAPRSILKNPLSKKRNLKWDEANLAQNESEKVPRMKVDEPKTPYHAPFMEDAEERDLDRELDMANQMAEMTRSQQEEQTGEHNEAMRSAALSHNSSKRSPPISPGLGPSSLSSHQLAQLDQALHAHKQTNDEKHWEESDDDKEHIELSDRDLEQPMASRADQAKHDKFEKLRRQHYNMAEALRRKSIDDEEEI